MNGFNTLRKHLHVMDLVMTLHVEVGKNLSCLYTCYISSCDALARVFFFWAQTNWNHRILRKHIQDISWSYAAGLGYSFFQRGGGHNRPI